LLINFYNYPTILEARKFEFEFLAIPDDTHHWMKFSNGVKVSEATADFLKRKLIP
jgi:hypothetical protein